ncbi:MAG: 2-hydroxyacid dehydrogenase [Saprospiraceae bacterium]
MLAAKREIPVYAKAAKTNNWKNRSQYGGDEIRGKTLGILGLGNIGQRVAELAIAFGMKVQYWNRTPKDAPYQQVDFDTLLATSDIISLHLPQVPATHHLINAAAFQKMKPTALLVNTARGSIIEETALVAALKNQTIAGFAADVLYNEPPVDNHPLFQFSNVLITPHTASLTALTFNEMCVVTVKNLVSFLGGESIDERFVFNREAF